MHVTETKTIQAPKLSGEVLELEGIWTRVADGNVELKVARDKRCVALASVGIREDALASAPRHIVSDGDKAIARATDMAYGGGLRVSCASPTCCASTRAT